MVMGVQLLAMADDGSAKSRTVFAKVMSPKRSGVVPRTAAIRAKRISFGHITCVARKDAAYAISFVLLSRRHDLFSLSIGDMGSLAAVPDELNTIVIYSFIREAIRSVGYLKPPQANYVQPSRGADRDRIYRSEGIRKTAPAFIFRHCCYP